MINLHSKYSVLAISKRPKVDGVGCQRFDGYFDHHRCGPVPTDIHVTLSGFFDKDLIFNKKEPVKAILSTQAGGEENPHWLQWQDPWFIRCWYNLYETGVFPTIE